MPNNYDRLDNSGLSYFTQKLGQKLTSMINKRWLSLDENVTKVFTGTTAQVTAAINNGTITNNTVVIITDD